MRFQGKKAWINAFALLGLVVAFFLGQVGSRDEDSLLESGLFVRFQIDSLASGSPGMEAYAKGSLVGFLSTGSSQGFGGPLEVIVMGDSSARIVEVVLHEHSETPSYMDKLHKKGFFGQFKGMELNSHFRMPDDVEAISGATMTSKAIASACRQASWYMAASVHSLPLPEQKKGWIFGTKEILAVSVFILALLTMYLKKKALRYIALTASFITLGFMFNASLSVAYFGRLLMGYLPDIREHVLWWVLMGGSLLIIILYGRNLYCHSICPFHAVQILLHKISGVNLSIRPRLNKILMKMPKYILWLCLVLILISRNPTISSFEPFSTLFSLEGAGIQWYILPVTLLGSLVFSDFFCRFFCPVGAGFKVLADTRRNLMKRIRSSDEIGPQ